jgi:prepilin-type N-terminal cleavage/methylation domain-containing protein
MFKFIKKQNIKKRGFSLVETLVALFVFSIAITATMAVMSQGITNINSAKKKVTASFLAQEGIEYVRNMRDTSVIDYSEYEPIDVWDLFYSRITPCAQGSLCYLDENVVNTTQEAAQFCDGAGICPDLLFNEGFYGYNNNGVNSGFKRIISVDDSGYLNGYIKVNSIVEWKENGITKSVTFSEYLTNWVE